MLTKLKYLNRIFDNNYSQTLPSRRSHSDKLIKKIFTLWEIDIIRLKNYVSIHMKMKG